MLGSDSIQADPNSAKMARAMHAGRRPGIGRALVIGGALLGLAGCEAPGPAAAPPEPPSKIRSLPPVRPIYTPPPPPPQSKPYVAPAPAPSRPVPQPTPESAFVPLDPASWMPAGGIRRGRWRTIVVHHSAAPNATPQGMDDYHRRVRRWENGLGYHFVVGNGVNFPDGAVHVGPRWRAQKQGAHCASGSGKYFGVWRPGGYFNEAGIGICLIGDFDRARPSAKQSYALRELVRFLCREAGINPSSVYGHGEVTHKTACPGANLDMAAIRRSAGTISASAAR